MAFDAIPDNVMIGKLNRRISFYFKQYGRDNLYGGSVEEYAETDTTWARIEFKQVGSGERIEADKLQPMTAALFTIRHREGITATAKILYDGLLYNILAYLPDEKRTYASIEAVQVGALREQSLINSENQSLMDADGNALLWNNEPDASGNYQPPKMVFRDANGDTFIMQ